jgi:hypothetical protein
MYGVENKEWNPWGQTELAPFFHFMLVNSAQAERIEIETLWK